MNPVHLQGLADDSWKQLQTAGTAPCNLQLSDSSHGGLWALQGPSVEHYTQEQLSINMKAELQLASTKRHSGSAHFPHRVEELRGKRRHILLSSPVPCLLPPSEGRNGRTSLPQRRSSHSPQPLAWSIGCWTENRFFPDCTHKAETNYGFLLKPRTQPVKEIGNISHFITL